VAHAGHSSARIAGRLDDLVEKEAWQARARARQPLLRALTVRLQEASDVPRVVPQAEEEPKVAEPKVVRAPGAGKKKRKVKHPKKAVAEGEAGAQPRIVDSLARPQARPQGRTAAEVAADSARFATSRGFDPRSVEVLSLDKPRAFLYRNFMTEEECDHLISISRGGLSKSGVVDAETGGSLLSDIRTSSGAFVGRGQDEVVRRIEERIALWSHIPVTHGEAIQVLRYENGQEYRAHFDYFFHKQGMANNRVATALLYLSDVEEGGETVFPNAPALGEREALQANWSACARQGVAVKPQKGSALLFWSMKVGGELDGGSSHAGCPVLKGVKWTATKWMHVGDANAWNVDHKVFKEPRPAARPGCEDKDDRCWSWAEQGECRKNEAFMRDTWCGGARGLRPSAPHVSPPSRASCGCDDE